MTWAPLWKEGPLQTLARKWERRKAKRAAKRLRKMASMEAWQLVRAFIYERDHGRCRVCGLALYLKHDNPYRVAHVHHITYRSAGGSDETSNLLLCCAADHEREHASQIEIVGNADLDILITVKDPETYKFREEFHSPCPTR